MFKLFLSIIMLITLPSHLHADSIDHEGDSIDYNSGICYDYNYGYYLAAAAGWKMDDLLASELNSSAAFYPDSFTSVSSPVVVFTNIWLKADSSISTRNIMDAYSQKFEEENPGSQQKDLSPILTKHKAIALVRSFISKEKDPCQMIAFIDLPGATIAIILSSHDNNEFEAYIDGFREIASSFFFITNKVRIENSSDSTKK